MQLGVEVVPLEVLLHAARALGRVCRRQDEVRNGAGRVRGRVEAEVAAVAGEADAERHLACRRGGRAVHGHGDPRGEPSPYRFVGTGSDFGVQRDGGWQ